MKKKMVILGMGLVWCLLFGLKSAFADGLMIIDHPWIGPIPQQQTVEALPVKYHHVTVSIDNQIATTSIDQVFRNEYDRDLEATYIFPLPEEATITEFAMYMNGKRVTGEILGKDEARKMYEDIVRKMKDPGLLEYVGRNMFKARVYPVPKHGEQRIELVYKQTLRYDAGMYKYVYPLNTEKFSPKPLEEVSISANVKSKVPIKNLYSPSHSVDTKVEQFQASCGYEAKNVTPDKDFILYYTVSEKDVGINLLSYRKADGDGYFMLLLSPGELDAPAIDKDIVFVVDTSGSMEGEKIKQAKEALRFCVNKLGKGDTFNVITFATAVNTYKDGLVTANEINLKEALGFIDTIEARGGTNIDEALQTALKLFSDSKRPRMVVFLTDGQPTVGATEIKDIVKNVAAANSAKTRIFVFGVGNDVNTHLLDILSQEQRGVSEYVTPQENIEVKVSSFYTKISEPVLADIKLDFGPVKARDVYPVILPDIFKGTQLVLLGKYEGVGAAAITLTGLVDGKEKKFVYEGTFASENTDNDFIPRIWATRKIGYLINEIRLRGENKELVDEIIKLSKEHGIMTQYTSFLIVEKDTDYGRRDVVQPMIRNGVAMEGKVFAKSMSSVTGGLSVSSAQELFKLKSAPVAQESVIDTVKQLGDKTFYLQDNAWVDAQYKKDMKTKEIKYLSEEYFNLIKQQIGLGKYFALAKNIIVVWEKECYRVTE